jgi:CHC2 zinc finger
MASTPLNILTDKSPNASYGFSKCCRAVRDFVPLEDIAGRYTNLKRFGGNAWFTGRCPLPDHEDRTASFYICPSGRWWCYGCSRGGDVVDLEFFCGDYGELWEAMIALAVEYDVALPQRPQRWHEKEARHARWREEADKVRAEVVRRRIFRLLILPAVNRIEKEEERREELMRAWRDFSAISWKIFVYWEDAT